MKTVTKDVYIQILRDALKPFAFYDEENSKESVQHAWEIMYKDRFQDWIDPQDIKKVREALEKIYDPD